MRNENRGFPVAESYIYKQKDNTSVTELKLVKRRLASFHFSCFFDKPNEFQDNNSCYAGRCIFRGSYD